MANTKPWQARVVQDMFIGTECIRGVSTIEARDAEIAELRAALAATTVIRTDAVRVCPDRDMECGNRPASWCSTCPKRGGCAAPVPQQAAGDAQDLPALPDMGYWQEQCARPTAYTAEQMAAYGRACMLAAAPSPPSEGKPQ